MVSIVIPLFNECDSLIELHRELATMAKAHSLNVELIFVDDGSTDASWTAIQQLRQSDARVRGLRLRRNFGKSAALAAGFRAARGDVVVTIDADLQDDPSQIPSLLGRLNHGLDFCCGWKQPRRDPWHKVLASRVFNCIVSWATGVHLHDHNCGLKCCRAIVLKDLRLYGELHRFIPVLAAARGFRVGEQPVSHRPRVHGQSKYGASRYLTGLLDMLTIKFLTSFGGRPQHLLGSIGVLSFLFGAAALLYLTFTWFVRLWSPDAFLPIHERALPIYAVAALLFGAQLLSLGFLAELLAARTTHDADTFSIAEEV